MAASEYGMGGQVSTQGDVYSYGILLLEMFTGKRPTDDIFKDGLSIHQFTAMALPDHVKDVVEPSLLLETDAGPDKAKKTGGMLVFGDTNRHLVLCNITRRADAYGCGCQQNGCT